jgi:predicted Zn-dependent peptidase
MKIKTLKNGVRVIIEKGDDKLRIGFYVLGGEYTESKKTVGFYKVLQHLLEHLVSKRWPDGRKNIKRLSRKGIKYNSSSNEYQTGVYLEGPQQHAEVMLDMLVSCITQFQIDEHTLNQAKKRVMDELDENLDNPVFEFERMLRKMVYPKHICNASIKRQIENVNKITTDEMAEFAKHALIPERIVMYMSGEIPKYETFKKYSVVLQTLPSNTPVFSLSSLNGYESVSESGIFRIKNRASVKRLHFQWAIDCTAFDYTQVAVIDAIGYGLHKVLNQKLRDEYNAVYYVNVKQFFDPINPRLSYLFIETDTLSSEKAKAIAIEIVRILSDYSEIFTSDVIKEFKEQSRDGATVGNIGLSASQLLWNQPPQSSKELMKHVEDVTLHKVLDMANEHFHTDKLYLIYNSTNDIFQSSD